METGPTALRVSPASRATSTPELLETILLHLDMRTLLTSALGVCRQWRDLIRTSPALRRVLFFDHDTTADCQNPTYNPLLVDIFPPLFDFAVMPTNRQCIDDLVIEELPVGRRVKAFYRRNASWRRMHVRQPPVEYLGIWKCMAGMAWSHTLKMMRCPAGLRMEELYFWTLKYSYEWQSSYLISWSKEQRQSLLQIPILRLSLKAEEAVEKMVQTADVILSAHFVGDCMYESDERKKEDKDGLVTIGGRWFKMTKNTLSDWESVWEEEDSGFWD